MASTTCWHIHLILFHIINISLVKKPCSYGYSCHYYSFSFNFRTRDTVRQHILYRIWFKFSCWAVGQIKNSVVTQPLTLPPEIPSPPSTSLFFNLRSSARWPNSKPRHTTSPGWKPSHQKLWCTEKCSSSIVLRVFKHKNVVHMTDKDTNQLIHYRISQYIIEY